MVDLGNLRVSLTKNGYMKIADVVRRHPSYEVLDNIEGQHRGINLIPSQVQNIMGADPRDGTLPRFWDAIRGYGDKAIDAFTFVAILFSHHRLIRTFIESGQGNYGGCILRSSFGTPKEYTNLAYAMGSLGLCEYDPGSRQTNYDLFPVVFHLLGPHPLVRGILMTKLAKCGWKDPRMFPELQDVDFLTACQQSRFHDVFAMDSEQFAAWMSGTLEATPPQGEFGLACGINRYLPARPR